MIEDAELSDRIADLLRGTPSPADIEAAITDAGEELARLEREHERAREAFLDPMNSSDIARSAREDSTALAFAIERLSIALQRLKEKHKEAVERVEEAERAAYCAAATAERDALADELRERYPELAGRLADLLARIVANNSRCNEAGIQRVENLVRGIPAHGYINSSPCAYLVDSVRLPDLKPAEAAYGRALWPAPVEHKIILPQSVHEGAARLGDKARRIGEEVAATRKAEAKSSIRRVR